MPADSATTLTLRLAVLGAVLLSGCAAPEKKATPTEHSPDERIAYYRARVAESPELYPAHALLGAALFDKARADHDPALFAAAREALARSLAIQPNYPAMKSLAAVANYTHRFEDAVGLAREALAAEPEDQSLRAMIVEARLALGQDTEAQAVIAEMPDRPDSVYRRIAQGQLHRARDEYDAAEKCFAAAADSAARLAGHKKLRLWATIMAAGMMLDSGRIDRARPHLAAARRLDPGDVELRIHEAELAAATGDREGAYRIYADLARVSGDPALHASAYEQAHALGRDAEARAHFAAAERGFQRALDAGEIYTLEALARLYLAAGVHRTRAADLARRNLEFKKDRPARALAHELSAPAQPPSPSLPVL
ncbi:MAG: hypothetical protein DCC65_14545 [Planctomycetota bacterium]|nr:MAG: hypothetical protein DCC65_14545 [Planctomycetota bacterium]